MAYFLNSLVRKYQYNTLRQLGRVQILNTRTILSKKVSGQLVLLGYDVTAFTPAAYQRNSLLRPLIEISS